MREYRRLQPDSRKPRLRVEASRILHRSMDRQIPRRQNTEPAAGRLLPGPAGGPLWVWNRTAISEKRDCLLPPPLTLLRRNYPSATLPGGFLGSCEARANQRTGYKDGLSPNPFWSVSPYLGRPFESTDQLR